MSDEFAQLDPTALELARVRASNAGLTLSEYVERLITARPVNPVAGSPVGPPRQFADEIVDDLEEDGAIRSISRFLSHVDYAVVLITSAFAEASVTDFKLPRRRRSHGGNWYDEVVETSLHNARAVRNALVHNWQPTPRAERHMGQAFRLLSDLTPARHELLLLYEQNRPRAFAALAGHLDVVARQMELSAHLVADVAADGDAPATDDRRFEALRNDLLDKAGGGLSLSEAADLAHVTRQAMHKRIKARSVLGMMHGHQLVLPRAQFVTKGDGVEVLKGLDEVLKIFEVAGEWSALQFLLDRDPNLGRTPLEALSQGKAEDVAAAARAYLSADED